MVIKRGRKKHLNSVGNGRCGLRHVSVRASEAVGAANEVQDDVGMSRQDSTVNSASVGRRIVDVMDYEHFKQIGSEKYAKCVSEFRNDVDKFINKVNVACVGCNKNKKIACKRSISVVYKAANVKAPFFAIDCCEQCGNLAKQFMNNKLSERHFESERFETVKQLKSEIWRISEEVKTSFTYPQSSANWNVDPLPDVLVSIDDNIKQLTCPMAMSCKIVRTEGVTVQNPAGRALSGHVMVVMNEGLTDLLKTLPRLKGEIVKIKKSWIEVNSSVTEIDKTKLINLLRYYSETSHPAFDEVDLAGMLEELNTEDVPPVTPETSRVSEDDAEVQTGSVLYTLATGLADPRVADLLIVNQSVNKVNEFERRRGWLSKMFPHLFPNGRGDITLTEPDPSPSTLREYYTYLLTQTPDGRFSSDVGFVFYVWDSLRRIELCKTVNWAAQQVGDVEKVLQSDGTVSSKLTAEERRKFYKNIHKRLGKSPMNWQYWADQRVELVDAVQQFGLPTVFFTVSCADYHWPDLAEYLRVKTSNREISPDNLRLYVGKHAGLVDMFFTEKMKFFSERFLQGYMGAKEVFYRFEWQKRGAAHIHGLAWVPGLVARSRSEANRMLRTEYDKWVTALRPFGECVEGAHPSKKQTELNRLSDDEYVKSSLEELIKHVQCHECNDYCTSPILVTCRFGLDGSKPLREQSEFIQVQNRIKFECARNDSRVTSYSAPALLLLRCNISMEVVADMNDVAAYVTKYILKNEKGSELFYTTMRAALNEEYNSGLFSKLKKILMSLQKNRDVSLAECHHNILSLPFVSKTWVKVKVDLIDEDEEIEEGDGGIELVHGEDGTYERSTVLSRKTLRLRDYLRRPAESEECTLVEFFRTYWKSDAGTWIKFSPQFKTRLVVAAYRSPVYETEFHNFPNPGYIREGMLLNCKYRAVEELSHELESWHESFTRHFGDDDAARRLFFCSSQQGCNPQETVLRRAVLTESMISQLENEYMTNDGSIYVEEHIDNYGNVNSLTDGPVFDEIPQHDLDVYKITYDRVMESVGTVADVGGGMTQGVSMSRKLRKQTVQDAEEEILVGELNDEQSLFVDFILHHSESENEIPVYHILHAAAGTGKSYCIRTLKSRLGRRMLVTATTGIAATIIGGETVHSVLKLSGGDNVMEDGSEKTKNKFEGVRYLFIDEFSMLDCELLSQIDENLREALQSVEVFGGISIVISGDTAQLPPVGGVSLFGTLTEKQNAVLNVAKGKSLFDEYFRTGHILVTNMRLISNHDERSERFLRIVQKLRTMENLSVDEQDLLKSRELVEISHATQLTAMHIFERNEDRQVMMSKLARIFECLGENVVSFVAKHVGGEPSRSPYHRQVDVYRGMRVMLLSNLNVKMGLANGAMGTVWYVAGNTTVPLVYVKFDRVRLPENWPVELSGCVPITSMGDSARGKANVLIQVPLSSASAITTYKCQGQTARAVVLHNCNKWPAGHKYVSISRVTSADGLFFKGDFSTIWSNVSEKRQNVVDAESLVGELMNSIDR